MGGGFPDHAGQARKARIQPFGQHMAEIEPQQTAVTIRFGEEWLARHEGDVLRQGGIQQRTGIQGRFQP